MATATEPIELVKSRIAQVDPQSANEEIERGDAVLIDTREPHEWDVGHLHGASLVPPASVAERVPELVPGTVRAPPAVLRERQSLGTRRRPPAERARVRERSLDRRRHRGLATDGPAARRGGGPHPEQRMRYSRHTLLPEVGVEGQLKLLDSKVLLIGAGGLGAPSAFYLAAAGVGTLGIVDDDVVDESNLQRQVIHNTERVGMPKTESARLSIQALNPDVEVIEHNTRLDADNILEIIEDYDLIVDGADNFPTRYLLNDASVRLRKPVVSASILAFEGQISTFVPYEGPCYRCLYPVPPPPELAPSCGAAGVLGVMAGVMGLLQANEVIKQVVGIGEPLVGRLLLYDSLGTRFTELKVRRDPDCPVCGDHAPELDESEMGRFPDYEAFCAGHALRP